MFGKKIRDLRMKRQLTQEQLTKELCVSRQAITKWENDEGVPDIENLKNLCLFFNISMDELIYNHDERQLLKEGCIYVVLFFWLSWC